MPEMARHRAVRGLANHWRNELDDLGCCSDDDYDDDAPPAPKKPQKPPPQKPPPQKPQEKQPFVSKKERQQLARTDAQQSRPLADQPPPPGLGLPPGLAPARAPSTAAPTGGSDVAVAALVDMGFGSEAVASALAQADGLVDAALERLVVDGATAAPSSSGGAVTPAAPAAPAPPSRQLNLVVVGHVDAGKSTLMGRLLLLAGAIDSRALHKCEKEADALGKASFKYALIHGKYEHPHSNPPRCGVLRHV